VSQAIVSVGVRCLHSSTAGCLCRARRWEDHPIQGFASKTFVTRLATLADAYPVADCHVSVFNPANLLTPLLIVDRVLALLVRLRALRCPVAFLQ
jgi:hypothetical protein